MPARICSLGLSKKGAAPDWSVDANNLAGLVCLSRSQTDSSMASVSRVQQLMSWAPVFARISGSLPPGSPVADTTAPLAMSAISILSPPHSPSKVVPRQGTGHPAATMSTRLNGPAPAMPFTPRSRCPVKLRRGWTQSSHSREHEKFFL